MFFDYLPSYTLPPESDLSGNSALLFLGVILRQGPGPAF